MELDKTQKSIVESSAKNIIVSAGAGSGKTRVLTERVKYLIESGVCPNEIVCITFTNKAANEMRERLSAVAGIGDAFIGTIHSFANHILKDSGKRYDLLTVDKEKEIISELISKYSRRANLDDYNIYIKMRNLEKLGAFDEMNRLPNISYDAKYDIDAFYKKVSMPSYMRNAEDLYDVCRKRGIITFDELIVECTKYFKKINGHINYLMVDELQDIGMNEYEFLTSLNAEHNFMVGDDWQSIYSFKGGDVNIFLHLMKNKNWTHYNMETNYRNATSILNIAKTVIMQANDITKKKVTPFRHDKGLVKTGLQSDLYKYLADIKNNQNYKDWFILVRTNKDIYSVSKELEKLNLPYETFKQAGKSSDEINALMSKNTVKILTVHTSKGLENKNVIVYGNFPIKLPSYKKVKSEERKILYVAMTRAMDELIVLN